MGSRGVAHHARGALGGSTNSRTARLSAEFLQDRLSTVIEHDNAGAENLLSQCERFLLSRAAATRIVSDMEATVRQRWYEVARREGVSEEDCQRISSAFLREGFRPSLQPDV